MRTSPGPRGDSARLGRLSRGVLFLAVPLLLGSCSEGSAPSTPGAALQARHLARGGAHLADSVTAPAEIEIFAPDDGDQVGVDGVGWFVDIAVDFDGALRGTGFNGNQLTGPGIHTNAPPFPGAAGPGRDDRFPGLVVLISTSSVGTGSCQNLANQFNLTGVTNRTEDETEIWDTWIIAAAVFGRRTGSTLYIAEVADLNHNGVHDDAPDVVPDVNHDGTCDANDLQALGLDSEVARKDFFIR